MLLVIWVMMLSKECSLEIASRLLHAQQGMPEKCRNLHVLTEKLILDDALNTM